MLQDKKVGLISEVSTKERPGAHRTTGPVAGLERSFKVNKNKEPMAGLENIPGLVVSPYGFELRLINKDHIEEKRIYFHTDYQHLRKDDLIHFPSLFAKVKNYLTKNPRKYTVRQKFLLEDLLSRNETTFIKRYAAKARFEEVRTIPRDKFPLHEIYTHFTTNIKTFLNTMRESTKREEGLAKTIIDSVIKEHEATVDSLARARLLEMTPPTLGLVNGSRFLYGPIGSGDEMSFAMSPFSDRTMYHNRKRAMRFVSKPEEEAKHVSQDEFKRAELENPFAKNNETRTPIELARITKKGDLVWFTSAKKLGYDKNPYLVRTVPNLYPGIAPTCFSIEEILDAQERSRHQEYLLSEEGQAHVAFLESKIGATKAIDFFRKEFHHYVIIDHPETFVKDAKTLDDYNHVGAMSRKHCNHILNMLLAVRKYNEEDPALKYVLVFKNWKGEAGASMPKAHHQVIGTPVIPTEIYKRVEMARVYGSRFFEEMLDFYESCNLLIAQKGNARAYSCPWPDFPGTIEIYMREKKVHFLEDLTNQDKDDFFGLMHIILSAIGGQSAYNYFFCDTPKSESIGKIPVSAVLSIRTKNNKAGAEIAGVPLSGYPPDIYAITIGEFICANEEAYKKINGPRHYKNLQVISAPD